jgi:hypothetical protein
MPPFETLEQVRPRSIIVRGRRQTNVSRGGVSRGLAQEHDMASKLAVPLEHHNAKDRHDIDRQVERILQHPLFQQSKRLPAFLRYIVYESLNQGSEGSTKERTLGVEVFGRRPDYDNNSDPIVRVTATELRKKLAQYYYEDGHSDEIRIELPPGSYLPKFRRSLAEDIAAADQTEILNLEASKTVATANEILIDISEGKQEENAPSARSARPLRLIAGALCLLLIAIAALFTQRIWRQSHSPLDRLWAELVGSSNRVLIVMPVIGSDNIKGSDTQLRSVSVSPNLSLEDTNLAVRIASQLERHEAHYQLVSSSEVSFDELRTAPLVLIGALDNRWTMRLTRNLPFVFEEAPDHRTGRIIDSNSGGKRIWTVDIDMPHTRIAHDYGLVARYTNRLTGEPVVVVAGISSQGTQAAGELLTSSEFETIHTIAQRAGNFEVVIETEAIDGHAGRPQIVASKIW